MNLTKLDILGLEMEEDALEKAILYGLVSTVVKLAESTRSEINMHELNAYLRKNNRLPAELEAKLMIEVFEKGKNAAKLVPVLAGVTTILASYTTSDIKDETEKICNAVVDGMAVAAGTIVGAAACTPGGVLGQAICAGIGSTGALVLTEEYKGQVCEEVSDMLR